MFLHCVFGFRFLIQWYVNRFVLAGYYNIFNKRIIKGSTLFDQFKSNMYFKDYSHCIQLQNKRENTVNGILKIVTVLKTKVEQLETRQKSLVMWKEKEERTIYHHDKRDLSDAGYDKEIEMSFCKKVFDTFTISVIIRCRSNKTNTQ